MRKQLLLTSFTLISGFIILLSCSKNNSSSGNSTTTSSTSGTTSSTTSGTTSGTTTGNSITNSFTFMGRKNYAITQSCNAIGLYYDISAIGGSSTSYSSQDSTACTIYFATQPNVSGNYTLVSDPNNLTASQAAISINAQTTVMGSMWYSQSGTVAVTVSNGNITGTFANVPFAKKGTTTPTNNGSGTLSCQ